MIRPIARPVMRPIASAIANAIHRMTPADLFQDGTIGVWYDPSDFSTLYQDAAGTTPFTALEQSVGLVVDKRWGGARGDEIANAGTASGWSIADARFTYASGSVSWAGGGGANASTSKVYLDSSYLSKFIELRFTVTGYSGSGNCGIDSGALSTGPDGGLPFVETRITANGEYRFFGYWRGGGSVDGRTIPILGRGTNSFTITNISVRELPGNHAYQTTSGARLTLKGTPNYVNFDGLDDHMLIASGGGGTAGFFLSVGIVAPTAGTVRTILSDRGTNTGYKVWLAADNTINFSAGNGTAHTTITSAALTAASKYAIQAWHDGTNLNLSINGVAVTPVAFATATAGSSSMTLGKSNTAASEYWSGRMYAPVYTRNKAPSAQQRQGVYQWLLTKMGGLA